MIDRPLVVTVHSAKDGSDLIAACCIESQEIVVIGSKSTEDLIAQEPLKNLCFHKSAFAENSFRTPPIFHRILIGGIGRKKQARYRLPMRFHQSVVDFQQISLDLVASSSRRLDLQEIFSPEQSCVSKKYP